MANLKNEGQQMKSYGGIIERATTYESLRESFDYVLRGNKRKTCRTGKRLLEHRDEVIKELQQSLRNGTFRISQYHEFEIKERGKMRTIQAVPLYDRIALNSVINEVERVVTPSYIRDTASSIKERGGLYLHKRIMEARRKNPHLRWFYKCDVKKYYHSIDQDLATAMVRRKFREPILCDILENCIRMISEGISIGLRSSQTIGNMFLSMYVDHIIKDVNGCKWFWRYCDDMAIGAESPRQLTPLIHVMHRQAAEAHLEIKGNEQVFCITDRPIDFLGYITNEEGKVRIRKHIKQRFARKWNRLKSRRRRRELIGSFYGMAKHAHSKHLFKTITGYNMKDFAELGISYVSQDGKKHFECPTVKLDDIQNTKIIVKDFETGVKTKEGEDRYIVLIEDEAGNESKFFTASEEMKQILTKVSQMGEIPFTTIIRRKNIGEGKKKYCFT